jgi:hypothetical protein
MNEKIANKKEAGAFKAPASQTAQWSAPFTVIFEELTTSYPISSRSKHSPFFTIPIVLESSHLALIYERKDIPFR